MFGVPEYLCVSRLPQNRGIRPADIKFKLGCDISAKSIYLQNSSVYDDKERESHTHYQTVVDA